jgi:hypothetical protein
LLLGVALSLSGCLGEEAEQKPAGPRPEVAVMSALPLFWREGGAVQDLGLAEEQKSQFILRLSDHYRPSPLDFLSDQSLRPIRTLILAQPRALQPSELVALDKWVRAGGELLAFVDPQLDWPSSLAIGDSRRPPPVTLLDPLLIHWKVRLEPVVANGVISWRFGGKPRTLRSPGTWVAEGGSPCQSEGEAYLVNCAIGKGKATLIGDADLLNFDDPEIDADANLEAIRLIIDSDHPQVPSRK